MALDVRRFAAHLIQGIARDARRAGMLNEREREQILRAATGRQPLPSRERRHAVQLAAKFWILSGGLSQETTSSFAGVDLQRPSAEVLETANRAIDVIAAGELIPVIVVDDSDSFTRVSGTGEPRDRLVGAFFGQVLRAVAGLRAGLVVAVHDEYLAMGSFQRARHEHGVLEQLAECNRTRTGRNLRTTITIAHAALVGAVQRGGELIDREDVSRAEAQQLGTAAGSD